MWWLKARRAHTVLPACLTGFLALSALLQDSTAALPSFLSGSQQVVVMMFVPLVPVAGLVLCLESRLHAAEATGIRRVAVLDAALVTATVAVAALASLALGSLTGSPAVLSAGRTPPS